MNSSEIRHKFLDYFSSKGHTVVASSPLVPGNDPTLLFTNSGMVQFKDCFLGHDKRPYVRATSSQRCVRAGGKHNDLENVGYTARHHTFFEMLGNFSFGDYFKHSAIKYAWELLTEVYGLPADRLWVTVYAEDEEAYGIWSNEIGVPAERIVRIGDNHGTRYASDNFWQMADTGPCGPCSEIFYDHGPDVAGGPPGSADADGDRYIEIWNLVFMQYNRDESGVLHPLPKPSVDTGMGLERIAAVLQHVHSNYDIDLFQSLACAAARETNTSDLTNNSLRVIADHIRACSFLIVDGVIPGNEGRGYVLRRIIRRAIRHGYKLGCRAAFFHKMVPDLVREMGGAYPELSAAQSRVIDTLRIEEERFFETIEHGMRMLEVELNSIATKNAASDASPGNGKNKAKSSPPQQKILDGRVAFTLHDTYGFPLDLTQDVCREFGILVDEAGFDDAMARQREQARAAGKFKMAAGLEYDGDKTQFHGYERLVTQSKVVALYRDGVVTQELHASDLGIVVLDSTPFYAESGGQVGDVGALRAVISGDASLHPPTKGGLAKMFFVVQDTQKIQPDVFGHHGQVKAGSIRVGDAIEAEVDDSARARVIRNHSATHLMHRALRDVLGTHVQQKGSLVDQTKTRFDFSHNLPMTDAEISEVEGHVNRSIRANAEVIAQVMTYDDALKSDAMALFGEKYGDRVRVLSMGEFSTELCGGTHVRRTGDIGLFKIVMESGVAAGVRRVEAVTGEGALNWAQQLDARVREAAATLKVQPSELTQRIAQMQDAMKALEKELAIFKSKFASSQGGDLVSQATEFNGVKILSVLLEGVDSGVLRDTLDALKDKLKSAVIVLAAVTEGKVALIAGVTADTTNKIKAGELVNMVAQQVGGKGGGRADMAQAGGTQPELLQVALASVSDWVTARLS
ncbi:MAG: alanine--tRNA ligase [Proteobacteria bacterium]|nr:alanine--tRNA ligase [Pseudomonadota bacterium]